MGKLGWEGGGGWEREEKKPVIWSSIFACACVTKNIDVLLNWIKYIPTVRTFLFEKRIAISLLVPARRLRISCYTQRTFRDSCRSTMTRSKRTCPSVTTTYTATVVKSAYAFFFFFFAVDSSASEVSGNKLALKLDKAAEKDRNSGNWATAV